MSRHVIEVRGVTKTFGGRPAVDDLTFSVPTGSVFGFIGPNGSGKTTTLRMIMNILAPDRGEIHVLGERDTRAARDRVSYLPEERGLYKKMTVRRLLAYYGRLKGAPGAKIDAAIEPWLERMRLGAYADKRIEALSKGMAQKVQFIAAVISEPDLVILDEPFSGLDPVNAEVLKETMAELRDAGRTIVFSTHDMGTAETLCDRICMVFNGKKMLDGTIDEVLAPATEGGHLVRIRTSASAAELAALPGVTEVATRGALHELRVVGDPQAVLRGLVASATVERFEIARPTLHETFIRIARPTASEVTSP